ncbi:MAG: efflux RND transporter periplasmic adaptor subunit, partial [Bacteroidetes bacterium]|nr:efflux RND transporter periplasmic adaptor subunit [Bacteroidota bacterium]
MRVLCVVLVCLLFRCVPIFAQGPPPAKVVVTKVTQEEIAGNQSVIGILYYERISHVSTEVAGLVKSISVNQGSKVKKDDVLVELNTEILDREIHLKKTRIEQIELRIENTRKNYLRLEKIFFEKGISEKDYDDALYVFQDAEKEKQATEDTLQKLLIQKRKSIIKAPFDGIVLSKDVDTGAWVEQGKQLVSIGSSNDLSVKAPIAESLLQFMNMGEKVPLTINA